MGGAQVHHVAKPGKGNVVRRMFADVDADIYVLADGDATYHAPSAPKLIEQLCEGGCDMVVGTRVHEDQAKTPKKIRKKNEENSGEKTKRKNPKNKKIRKEGVEEEKKKGQKDEKGREER